MTFTTSTSRLAGRYIERAAIPPVVSEAMFGLLASYFSGVERSTFDSDLREKNWVILLEDESGTLRGFSTLLAYEDTSLGRPVTVIYSGDTIVARDWWGSSALPGTWIRAVLDIAPLHGHAEIYWLLITSGYRTYRFLPVFFREFHPQYGGGEAVDPVVRVLARARFGDRFDEATGIVRLEHPQVLVPELLEVPPKRRLDPHIEFFLARNPGYVRGDELVCVTRICDENLTPAARRMTRKLAGRG